MLNSTVSYFPMRGHTAEVHSLFSTGRASEPVKHPGEVLGCLFPRMLAEFFYLNLQSVNANCTGLNTDFTRTCVAKKTWGR